MTEARWSVAQAVEEITGRVPLFLRCRIECEPTVIKTPDNADERMIQVVAHTVDELSCHDHLIAKDLAGGDVADVGEDSVRGAGLRLDSRVIQGWNENDEMAVEVL